MSKEYNNLKKSHYSNFAIILLIIISCSCSCLSSFGQTPDEQKLANSYYQNKEFDKAEILFEDFYKKTRYKSYRDKYISCLKEQSKFDKAEKFLKKEIKKNKQDFYLRIDLGVVYLLSNRVSESKKEFDAAINIVKNNRNSSISAANTFLSNRLFEEAEKTYIAAGKQTNTDFSIEMANLHFYQRDYSRMMTEYVKHILKAPNDLGTIKNKLSYISSQSFDNSLDLAIETSLLNTIQKHPTHKEINDLLIWHYTQTHKFELALKQLIAIDKRSKSGEKEILEFSEILRENNKNKLALEAYNYILAKGKKNTYYLDAYIGSLNVKYQEITSEFSPAQNKLIEIEEELTNAVEKLSRKESYSIIYNLINLKAFFLDKKEEAIELIIKCLGDNRFDENQELVLSLLLADIYMLNNMPWDAILTYAKIENNRINSELGELAKFKKAKLSYYLGEFKWSQAQLDVLKAATSRLISNDAIELSLFITDNYNLDSTENTMKIFARADLLILGKKYEEALSCLDSIINIYPSHTLIDDVIYRKAQIYEEIHDYEQAAAFYKEVYTKYYYDILADNSLYKYAILQEKLNNNQEAQEAYLKIITDFPNSIFVIDARKKLRKQE